MALAGERNTLLRVERLEKAYTIPGGKLQVLHDVNFTVHRYIHIEDLSKVEA